MSVNKDERNLHSSPEDTHHRQRIVTALEALLERRNVDSFVICSHANSHEFVQFAVNDQGLFLDLPAIPLDREQTNRAMAFFNSLGVDLQDSQMLDEPDGRVVGEMQVFQVELKYEAERGAKLALEVFEKVYLLPSDFRLAIEEN